MIKAPEPTKTRRRDGCLHQHGYKPRTLIGKLSLLAKKPEGFIADRVRLATVIPAKQDAALAADGFIRDLRSMLLEAGLMHQ